MSRRAALVADAVLRHRLGLLAVAAVLEGLALTRDGAVPADLAAFSATGRLLLQGRLDAVYADPFTQAGPLELIAASLALPAGSRAGELGLTALYVLGNLAAVTAVVLGGRVVRTLTGLPASPVLELLAGLATIAWLVPGQLWSGHLAGLAVPVTWLAAGTLAVRGRTQAAGVLVSALCGALIGVASAWEPWGIVAAPLLLIDRRPRRLALGVLALVATAAFAYAPFALTGRFALFDQRWPVSPATLLHLLRPDLGEATWWFRLLQGGLAVTACAAVALVLGRRRDVVWLAPLAAVLARLLLDPTGFAYYWVPAQVLGLVGVTMLNPRRPWRRLVPVAAMGYLPFLQWGTWAVVQLLVTSGVLVVAVAGLREAGAGVSAGRAGRSRAPSPPRTPAEADRSCCSCPRSFPATARSSPGAGRAQRAQ